MSLDNDVNIEIEINYVIPERRGKGVVMKTPLRREAATQTENHTGDSGTQTWRRLRAEETSEIEKIIALDAAALEKAEAHRIYLAAKRIVEKGGLPSQTIRLLQHQANEMRNRRDAKKTRERTFKIRCTSEGELEISFLPHVKLESDTRESPRPQSPRYSVYLENRDSN